MGNIDTYKTSTVLRSTKKKSIFLFLLFIQHENECAPTALKWGEKMQQQIVVFDRNYVSLAKMDCINKEIIPYNGKY